MRQQETQTYLLSRMSANECTVLVALTLLWVTF